MTEGKDMRFSSLTTQHGLSESRVVHILQDDQGFIWFGTSYGLNRYDGYSFKIFRHDPKNPGSLSGVFITALLKDRSGVLWVGVDQYLDRFDPSTEKATHYWSNPSDPTSLAGHIEHIYQDRGGILWLATRNGLDRLDPNSGKFTHYRNRPDDPNSLSDNDVRFTYEDHAGTLWVAAAGSLESFDCATGKFAHHPYSQKAVYDRVYEDRLGHLWVSSTRGKGLAMLDRQTGKFIAYDFSVGSAIGAIYEDEDGILWLAAIGDGLLRFDYKKGQVKRYRNDPTNPGSLSSNVVLALFEDREGSMWVGTAGGGVNRFTRKLLPFVTYRKAAGSFNSLDRNFVLSVFEDSQGSLWMGTDHLNRLDRKTGHYKLYKAGTPGGLSHETVYSTVEDRDGFLWMSTLGGGVNRFDRKTERFQVYRHNPADPHSLSHDSVLRLFVDHAGTLWAATEDGLDRFDSKTKRFKVYRSDAEDPAARLYPAIAEDLQGRLWLGTYESGLQRFDPTTGRFKFYRHDPRNSASLSNNRVNAIHIDRAGIIWVGTQSGLNRFDPKTGSFSVFYERDGLPHNAVQGILEDGKGNLWLSTSNGLSKFDPRTRVFENYFASDGLAGSEFDNYGVQFKSKTGEMFFGGIDGVTSFFPDQIVEDSRIPPVVLTDFRLFNDPVPIDQDFEKAISYNRALTLSHQQSIFSLGFSTLSYLSPERNRYRYKLDGLEKEWNEIGSDRRFATYTTLPPGNYVFRVQGSNHRGLWNEKGVSLPIHIEPAWWTTWWFRGLLVALIAGVAWALHHLRVQRVEKRNLELARIDREIHALNERLITAQEEERRRIARELHDEFSQQIAVLSISVSNIRQHLPPKQETRDQIERVHQKLVELAGNVRRISHELHPAILEYAGLGAALRTYCTEFTAMTGVRVSCLASDTFDDLSPAAALCVYRVTQEALQNVAKHSAAKDAEVRLTRSNGFVSLTVSDQGAGCSFTGPEAQGGLGLVSMRERARLVRGTFDFKSGPNLGTTVMVGIPVAHPRE